MAFEFKNIKHGSNIVELGPGYSLHEEITAPMIAAFGEKDLEDSNFSLGWAFIDKPLVIIDDSHKHDHNQVLFFIGGNPNNAVDFDAEIELTLDGKVHLITYAACIYVPKGLMHCPLIVKSLTKPLVFIDIRY